MIGSIRRRISIDSKEVSEGEAPFLGSVSLVPNWLLPAASALVHQRVTSIRYEEFGNSLWYLLADYSDRPPSSQNPTILT